MKNIVVFSGAGMSAESGLRTFRDSDGLWEKHKIEEVATLDAFEKNPQLVLEFYTTRFLQMTNASPNAAHLAIAKMEERHRVSIITQNVDDLHERAGSSKVLHLHGELSKCRSTVDQNDIREMPKHGLKCGDLCNAGYQLRPHIVWFGEMVPNMEQGMEIVKDADILVIIGTSLSVYPAAGLAYAAENAEKVFLIDPAENNFALPNHFEHIKKMATVGVAEVLSKF